MTATCFVLFSRFFYDNRRNSHKQNPSPSLSGKSTKATLRRRWPGTKKLLRQLCHLRPVHKTSTFAFRALICMLFTTLLPPTRRCVYYWQRFCRPCADLHTICSTFATRAPICTLFTTLLPAVCRPERPRISPERPPYFLG